MEWHDVKVQLGVPLRQPSLVNNLYGHRNDFISSTREAFKIRLAGLARSLVFLYNKTFDEPGRVTSVRGHGTLQHAVAPNQLLPIQYAAALKWVSVHGEMRCTRANQGHLTLPLPSVPKIKIQDKS